jgi:hypothetical protein
VSNAATRALAPTVQGAVRGLAPASGLIHPGTSSLATAGHVLTTVIVSAAGSVAGTLTPASSVGGKLISAPQGAPAALRGATDAIGALGSALWGAASSAPVSRALELLGSSLPTPALGPRAGKGMPRTLAQRLTAAVLAALLGVPAGGPSAGGPVAFSPPPVVAGAQEEAVSGRFAGASGCALYGRQGLLGGSCGAEEPPPRFAFPSRAPMTADAAAGSALGTSMARAASDGSSGARAGPGSRGAPGAVPVPAPSGASGSAAGFGFAVSISLMLAALLLLAAPRAMRRLRLLREPWLQARFVLIPERPG